MNKRANEKNINMKMTERVLMLREQSLNAKETITAERAQLITRFYASGEARGLSAPVTRARAFEYLLRNKAICVNEGEMIVGERGPAPKATPTYPEICLHSLQDLDILNDRPKVSFKVSDEVKHIYEDEIIPFWKGHSNRDRIMERMLSLIHISEPTRRTPISYAVFCLKKKKKHKVTSWRRVLG